MFSIIKIHASFIQFSSVFSFFSFSFFLVLSFLTYCPILATVWSPLGSSWNSGTVDGQLIYLNSMLSGGYICMLSTSQGHFHSISFGIFFDFQNKFMVFQSFHLLIRLTYWDKVIEMQQYLERTKEVVLNKQQVFQQLLTVAQIPPKTVIVNHVTDLK